jgi:hypothetical protein
MAGKSDRDHSPIGLRGMSWDGLRHGLRTAVRNNASAFAYSVLATATFGMLTIGLGTPSRIEILLFAVGATSAFAVVEASASNFFRDPVRPERSNVVLLGSALSVASVTLALSVVIGVTMLFSGWVAWLLAPMVATVVYLLTAGLEMALARARQDETDEKQSPRSA